MTDKQRDKFYNAAISLIVAISGVCIAASFTSDAASKKDVETQLRNKASVEYVDKQNDKQDENVAEKLDIILQYIKDKNK